MGEKNNDRDGYGAYNTHNQFLQSVLHNGWIGVIVFLLCFVVLIELAVKSKRRNYAFLIIVLLLYACIESVLETQYGIVLFCFFPLFLYPLSKTGTKQTFSSDYPIK
jgi:O-antigen ligase